MGLKQAIAEQFFGGKAGLGLVAFSFLTGIGFAAAPEPSAASPTPAAGGPAASLETQKQARVWVPILLGRGRGQHLGRRAAG